MTYLFSETPILFGDICEEIRLFIDTRKIERIQTDDVKCKGYGVFHYFSQLDETVESTAKLVKDGRQVASYIYQCAKGSGELVQKRVLKRAVKISVYRALISHFKIEMPWGSLTGIRPTKLLRDSETRIGEKETKSLFIDEFDVSRKKYDFAKSIVNIQEKILPDTDNDVDVYIGIPFCVTRCAYCSFASNTPDVFSGAEQQYVDALMQELAMADELLNGRKVRALYIGGGTPTAISSANLEKILARAAQIAQGFVEFTVEAGRPDTITQEKLEIIKANGAERISVNAQTLVEQTLSRIGRGHTARQFFDAYQLAKNNGFDVINVDVIAGLPGETIDDFTKTLKRIIELEPDNITLHTLAIKRASAFAAANMDAFPTNEVAACMLEKAHDMLKTAGHRAYYMYRQKYMKASMENTGYAKKGKECLYNIDNMEEVCDVAAFGAGGISKRIYKNEGRIMRAANVKDLREYVKRVSEMCDRKKDLFKD